MICDSIRHELRSEYRSAVEGVRAMGRGSKNTSVLNSFFVRCVAGGLGSRWDGDGDGLLIGIGIPSYKYSILVLL